MSDRDQLLARVRKLLAQAEDPGATEAEAEAFNTKAAELVARYGIDQAMLAAEHKTRDEITQVTIDIDNPYSLDKAHLLNVIAQPLRCNTVRYTRGKTTYKMIVFGFASDLDRVQLLYTSLLMQATTHLAHVRPDNNGWYYESVAAYRRTWLAGFTTAVYRRLTAAEARAVQQDTSTTSSGQSTALVLRDRQTQVDDAYRKAFPHLAKDRPRYLSGSGYGDGHAAGQRANLHTTNTVGTKPADQIR